VILLNGKAEVIIVENVNDEGSFRYETYNCNDIQYPNGVSIDQQNGNTPLCLDKLVLASEIVMQILLKEKVSKNYFRPSSNVLVV
jgi:hypothetical protein